MSYPYAIMRTLASPVGGTALRTYARQLTSLERRMTRRLQKGVSPNDAKDIRALIKGCQAALDVLYETPEIIERWDATATDESAAEAQSADDGNVVVR